MARRWNTLRAVQCGALTGLACGLCQVAASWQAGTDHTFQAVGMPFGAAIYGAALFVAVAKIRNLVLRAR